MNNQLEKDQFLDENNSQNLVCCKNCETEFTGNFCPECRQSVREMEKPILSLMQDIISLIGTFDIRLFKTLVAVCFKPGEISLNYLEGKRMKYLPPIKFYATISFMFFLLLGILTSNQIEVSNKKEKQRKSKKENIALVKDSISNNPDTLHLSKIVDLDIKIDSLENKKTSKEKDINFSIVNGDNVLGKDEKTFEAYVDKKSKKIKKDPQKFVLESFNTLSWVMFFLLPIYAFLLRIFFWKAKKYYISHFIFAVNQHAFAYIIFSILVLVNILFSQKNNYFEFWLLAIMPIYFIVGAKNFYKRRWFGTILRKLFIFLLYFMLQITGVATAFAFSFFKDLYTIEEIWKLFF